jgi:hypothetical protein
VVQPRVVEFGHAVKETTNLVRSLLGPADRCVYWVIPASWSRSS